jgi:ornithine cyclodeaminase/alanine dehydrogenase-like protein (mu-crystallin family)
MNHQQGVMSIRRLFEVLRDEYMLTFACRDRRLQANPLKTKVVTRRDESGILLAYLMLMPALLSDGTLMSKSIYVEDDEKRSRGTLELFYPDGSVFTGDATTITKIRSALMAAIAAYYHNPDLDDCATLGLVGTGEMNKTTFAVFNAIFGIDQVVIRGSKRDRGKNADFFKRFGALVDIDASSDGRLLNGLCDVVVSCTNSSDLEEALPVEYLPDPKTIILQDGSYGIRVRGRHKTFYTDYPEQTAASWDDEFPECELPEYLLGLKSLRSERGQALVTLYGIAFADAVVAREIAKIQ